MHRRYNKPMPPPIRTSGRLLNVRSVCRAYFCIGVLRFTGYTGSETRARCPDCGAEQIIKLPLSSSG